MAKKSGKTVKVQPWSEDALKKMGVKTVDDHPDIEDMTGEKVVRFKQKKFGVEFEVMLNGPCVIVSFKTGNGKTHKGVSKCKTDETFNKRVGTALAMRRCLNAASGDTIHALKNEIRRIEGSRKNYISVFNKIVGQKTE